MLKHIALGAALALLLAGPALAQDRPLKRDPCALYRANAAAESMMADGYGRVCKLLGPTRLTQACMDYYMLLTNPILHLSDKGKAARAAECERSMPGGSTLVQTGCAPGADCATADDSGGNLPAPAPAANDDAGMPAPSVGPTTGSSDTMECGNGAECRPPPDSEIVTDEENAAGLDLAFWNSIKDSTSPDLFRAYLEQFPKGVFRAIAEDRLKTLAGGAATPPAPAAAPGPAPQAAAGRDDALAEFGRAEAIMNRAYDMDASRWGEAAQKAVPLYLAAAKGGVAKAWMALGDLYENGIGVSVDETRAVDDFLRAGRAGLADGYVRALMLFDQRGKKDRYIETFLAFYRVAPTPALGSFDSVSQRHHPGCSRFWQNAASIAGRSTASSGPARRPRSPPTWPPFHRRRPPPLLRRRLRMPMRTWPAPSSGNWPGLDAIRRRSTANGAGDRRTRWRCSTTGTGRTCPPTGRARQACAPCARKPVRCAGSTEP